MAKLTVTSEEVARALEGEKVIISLDNGDVWQLWYDGTKVLLRQVAWGE